MVVRRDLAMPVGKIASQVAHGSMAWLTREKVFSGQETLEDEPLGRYKTCFRVVWDSIDYPVRLDNFLTNVEYEWLNDSYTKIVLGVDSEEELLAIHQKALDAGLVSHLVTDNGTTVFNGQPTNTVVAIGPDFKEKIDPITSRLKLL